MSAKRINPFSPGKPAPLRAFAGRRDELAKIDRCLENTRSGNPQCFIVEGQEGIGKTSLMRFAAAMARGDLKPRRNTADFRFEVISVVLDADDKLDTIIAKIGNALEDSSQFSKRASKAVKIINRLKNLSARADTKTRPDDVFSDLCARIDKVFECEYLSIDGLVLLLDEAHKPSTGANLGIFCRALIYVIQKKHPNFCVGLAGRPVLIDRLRESHPSAPDMFQIFSLEPLDDSESAALIEAGLESSCQPGRASRKAIEALCRLAQGYPHFLQEFCFQAFAADADNFIDLDDLKNSLSGEHTALYQICKRYFPSYNNNYAPAEYHDVLHCLAERDGDWLDIFDVGQRTGLYLDIVRDALAYWNDQHMIFQNEERKNLFRIRGHATAVWIRAHYVRIGPSRDHENWRRHALAAASDTGGCAGDHGVGPRRVYAVDLHHGA